LSTPQSSNGAISTAPSPPPSTAPVKTEESPFFFYGGSEVGAMHLSDKTHQGKGNQDCFGHRAVFNDSGELLGVVGVTADGCGDIMGAMTGSQAAVRIVLNSGQRILETLGKATEWPKPEALAKILQHDVLTAIRNAASPLTIDGNINQIVETSYLFTLLITLVTPFETFVFGCGDGLLVVNGKEEILKPREGNEPEYLAYLLCDPIPQGFENIGIKVLRCLDTKHLETLVIGTDGLEPLIKGVKGFQLADLWRDLTLRNPGTLAEKFQSLNAPSEPSLSVRNLGPKRVVIELKEENGEPAFEDDVTGLVFSRVRGVQFPPSWVATRRKFIPSEAAIPVMPPPFVKQPSTAPPWTKAPTVAAEPKPKPQTYKDRKDWSFMDWVMVIFTLGLCRPILEEDEFDTKKTKTKPPGKSGEGKEKR